VIGHDQVVWIERALHAIQRLQPLAFARAPHHNAALDLVQIEGVRRLAIASQAKLVASTAFEMRFCSISPKYVATSAPANQSRTPQSRCREAPAP